MTTSSSQSAETYILDILRGSRLRWPESTPADFIHSFLKTVQLHGLAPLIHHLSYGNPDAASWPATVTDSMRQSALSSAAHELRQQIEIQSVLRALSQNAIRPIVLKGTALAYTIYDKPWLRTRGDTDLLVPRKDIGKTLSALEQLGYRAIRQPGLLGQEIGVAKPGGVPLDIHWRLSSYFLLSQVLSHKDLLADAIPLPSLSNAPCAISPIHALLHACIHWAKHRACGDSIRLIWLYDILSLAQSLSADKKQTFVQLAVAHKLSSLCKACLAETNALLDSPALAELSAALPDIQGEASARMLLPHAPTFKLSDLLQAPGLLANLQDALFPPIELLRMNSSTSQPLPLLHLRRLASIGNRLWRR